MFQKCTSDSQCVTKGEECEMGYCKAEDKMALWLVILICALLWVLLLLFFSAVLFIILYWIF